jgi:large subunit ribosomal protein L23e
MMNIYEAMFCASLSLKIAVKSSFPLFLFCQMTIVIPTLAAESRNGPLTFSTVVWSDGFVFRTRMSKRGRTGQQGTKSAMTLALPVGAVVQCADNSGAKTMFVICVRGRKGRLNRLPPATVSDLTVVTIKKGKPTLRKTVTCGVIVRQKRLWRRKDGVVIGFEDNAGAIINDKGEMKGSAITGPVAKECSELWPKITSVAPAVY